jgi:hypothetical protein
MHAIFNASLIERLCQPFQVSGIFLPEMQPGRVHMDQIIDRSGGNTTGSGDQIGLHGFHQLMRQKIFGIPPG